MNILQETGIIISVVPKPLYLLLFHGMKFNRIYIICFLFFISAEIKGQISITSISTVYTENFDGIGTSATASLPSGWKVSGSSGSTAYGSGGTVTTQAAGTSGTGILTSSSTGGAYNFANGVTASSSDRAVGFLTSSTYTSSRCLMVKMVNNTGITISNFNISYDIEKYISGTRQFDINFGVSTNGTTWTAPTTAGDQSFPADANNTTVYDPPTTVTKSFSITGLSIANGSSYYFKWQYTGSGGSTSPQGIGIDNFSVICCPTVGYYYRSYTSGNYSSPSTWEVSSNGSTWTGTLACNAPTNLAAGVTILSGHTVTVDANSTAPGITINNGGTLQANSSSFVSLTISGNLVNNGTLQMYNSAVSAVNVIFNKNGSQTITGSGSTTNFYSIGLNMGTSPSNILTISSTNFSSSSSYLLTNNLSASTLLNGTIKFSGSYTFSNSLFSAAPTIPSTAEIWLNNANVTIAGQNYTYNNSGTIRVTAGTYNFGTVAGNSISLLASSNFIVEGGTVNVAGRLQAVNSSGTPVYQANVTYLQSGGVVTLETVGSTSTLRSSLEFDLSSDNFFMSGGTIVFRNEATATDLYNNANSIISGGTIQFGDALSTNIDSYGFWVQSPSTLPSIVINNSSGKNPSIKLADNLTVTGSITINSGTTLSNSFDDGTQFGGNIYDKFDISLTGSWNNSGTFTNWNANTVSFNGSAAQQITGTTSTEFNRLTINNSSGGVSLQTNQSVDSVLSLTNGLVFTSSGLLTMNTYSSVSGVSNSSFVSGPLAKVGATGFTFPIGKDAEYRPIADSALSAAETFTAEYFHTDPGALYSSTSLDPAIDHISYCEYWNFSRPAGSSVNAFVKPSWDTYSCGVDDIPNITVAHWDGTTWNDLGNGGTAGTVTSGTVITNAIVSSFSPFTLASHSSNNPLPIELLSFTANYNGSNAVDLNWATASETNNDYFTVERSADAVTFTEINKTKGAGNSTQTLYYKAKDSAPLSGVSYYRLKQTDFNGNYKYSNVASVNIINNSTFEIINTFSASPESGLDVTVNCSGNCEITFELYDITGKRIYSTKQNMPGNYSDIIIPTYLFSKGMYLLKAFDGTAIVSKKIIIQ